MKPKDFHAVAIVCGTNCCTASHAIEGIRYLSAEAPRLPLEECSDVLECACTYRHYLDRRAPPDRAHPLSAQKRRAMDKARDST